MTPQIVLAATPGRHNDALEQSAARVAGAGVWKLQRIVMLIPAGRSIPTKVALAHWNLMFPPNQAVARIAAIGMEVGEAYSSAIDQVLAHPDFGAWEYLLTVEHDNMPPADGVMRLIAQMEAHPEFFCIGGLYWTKGEGGVPQIWGDPRDPVLNFRPQVPRPGELVECCGTGMGFNLWRLQGFRDERLRKPWFKTQTEGGAATQDLYFWADARKHGFRCAIDCSVLVGHYDMEGKFGPPDTVW